MIYVTSDLHGISVSRFRQLLALADFSGDDFLFVLGDVIDRGTHGIELLRLFSQMPNVQLVMGNHETLMLSCRFLFREVTDESLESLTVENLQLVQNWMDNGGGPTIRAMQALTKSDPELAEGIWEYLLDAPLYESVRSGGKQYILTHSGLGNFNAERALEDYTPEELLLHRPAISDSYFSGATVIFGHTPTQLYGEAFSGRALRTGSWINIDTGAAAGGTPMLLRLGDEKEFYL